MSEAQPPSRRLGLFNRRSILELFLVCIVVAMLGLGVVVFLGVLQRSVVREIERAGGRVLYSWNFDAPTGRYWLSDGKPDAPRWLVDLLGKDAFGSVVDVSAFGRKVDPAMIRSIQGLHALRKLRLGRVSVSEPDLVRLSSLGRLRHLELSDCKLGDEGLKRFATLREVEELILSGTRVGDASAAHLARMPNLTTLDLGGTSITDAGLAELAKLPRLNSLVLDDTRITDAGLAELGRMPTLKHLRIVGTWATDAGLKRLAGTTGLSDLTVDVEPPWRTEAGLQELGRSHGRPAIIRLAPRRR